MGGGASSGRGRSRAARPPAGWPQPEVWAGPPRGEVSGEEQQAGTGGLVAGVALTGAAQAKRKLPVRPPQTRGAKAPAPVSDPAEPPLKVEATFARPHEPASPRQSVEVTSSARGTVLTLNTPGSWRGSASLTVKGAAPAPPMR